MTSPGGGGGAYASIISFGKSERGKSGVKKGENALSRNVNNSLRNMKPKTNMTKLGEMPFSGNSTFISGFPEE